MWAEFAASKQAVMWCISIGFESEMHEVWGLS